MHKIAAVWCCLACVGHGRRTHQNRGGDAFAEVQSTAKSASRTPLEPLTTLAELLLALKSASAFQPHGAHSPTATRTTLGSRSASGAPLPVWRHAAVQLGDEEEPDPKKVIEDAEDKMKKAVSKMEKNLASLRTGRASPAILDRVMVDYYETMTPLKELANIKTSSATQLTVDPYDKTAIDAMSKAIALSDLGISPQDDGEVIRLNMPPMTEEMRKDLAKKAKKMGEEGKVAIRNVRKNAMDQIKKMKKKISEDAVKGGEADLQKAVKKIEDELSKIVSAKEKDITTL